MGAIGDRDGVLERGDAVTELADRVDVGRRVLTVELGEDRERLLLSCDSLRALTREEQRARKRLVDLGGDVVADRSAIGELGTQQLDAACEVLRRARDLSLREQRRPAQPRLAEPFGQRLALS